MGFPVEPGGAARTEAAAAFLSAHRAELERLADRVDLEWYAFAGEVAPLDPAQAIAGPSPRGGRTDLLGALRAVASGAGGASRPLAGALVVSDGATTPPWPTGSRPTPAGSCGRSGPR